MRHIADAVRGEYRDRLFVRHADLRLYSLAMSRFEAFQAHVKETAPAFRYVNNQPPYASECLFAHMLLCMFLVTCAVIEYIVKSME